MLTGDTMVTDTLLHTSRKAAAGGVVHTYLIDIGPDIEIHGIGEDGRLTSTPFFTTEPVTATRFFEVVLDAAGANTLASIRDIRVSPVHAKRTGGLSLFGFVLIGGKWIVTERPEFSGYGSRQWAYTDDFNLLHVTSGDMDVETMAGLIVDRINAIANSIRAGNRAPSHAENRYAYQESIYSFVSGSREMRERKARERLPADFPPVPQVPKPFAPVAAPVFAGDLPGTALPEISIPSLELGMIEEISDASWLFE
ncbi:MAG TPA: hypothetical protein VLY83_05925 [Methanoregula sp.]|nr:hypothetical protein [Methanoregula sp.]